MYKSLAHEKRSDFFWGLLIPVVLTVPFLVWSLDLEIESFFYDRINKTWTYVDAFPWAFLYNYGHILIIVTIFIGLALLIMSIFKDAYIRYRIPIFFYFAALAFGPGYLVNTTLKEYWGRPRPREIIQFDGTKTYIGPLQPGIPGNGQSFPSGHASTGFSFFALAFALRQVSRKWSSRALLFALSFGLLMGIGRNIQGGHFPTDVIWSGAVCWLSSAFLYHFLFFRESNRPFSAKGKLVLNGVLLFMLFQLFFLTAFYKEYHRKETLSEGSSQLTIDAPGNDIQIIPANAKAGITIDARSQGLGITDATFKEKYLVDEQGTRIKYSFERLVLKHSTTVSVAIDTSAYTYTKIQADSLVIHFK